MCFWKRSDFSLHIKVLTQNHHYDEQGFLLSSSTGVNSRSARVLFVLVAPGHLVFLYTIHLMRAGHTTLTYIFIAVYLTAALLQVHAESAVLQ